MAVEGLRRVLGLPAVTFVAVGFTVGAGVFVFTGIVFKQVGAALPLAYALAAIPVFITMLPVVMLGATIPTVGGNYRYPSRLVSPGLAFVGVWVYALCAFFGQIPLYALGCAHYLRAFFPALPEVPFAIALLTTLLVVNLVGLRLAAWVQGAMVLLLLAALLFFAGSGLAQVELERLADPLAVGGGALALGTALLTFTYFGANGIIELGGEIRDPGRTIPRALFIAFPIITGVYLLVAAAAVGAVDADLLHEAEEPLLIAGRAFLGREGLAFFVVGGAVFALTTTLNALLMVGTKSLLVVVDDKLLPAALGWLHPRLGTPQVLLGVAWLISVGGVLSGLSLETFASFAALGSLLVFAPVLIAAWRLPRRLPGRYAAAAFKLGRGGLGFCVAIGLCMVLFFGAVILVDLKSPLKLLLFCLFVLSGAVYYVLRTRQLARRGIDVVQRARADTWHDSVGDEP